eukprot:CAMPEP_0183461196 /NCGR_PEP_ID=MMETSP0370-20130417/139159_1 /TAXON_ID=268820 /ORGANISM="Peridinium aciculiferum, Strain PAER-2" /LENGTH=50 /DNA_ID=CAMNT_0025653147 /DNA_START=38 /DNA_END=187 /DNA_ORIENTATION=+
MWVKAQHPKVFEDPSTFFHTGMIEEAGQTWARLVGIQTSRGKGNGRLLDG